MAMGFLRNEKIIVGYDLSDRFSQISYATLGEEKTQTLSAVAGEEKFTIPTVLCKHQNANIWAYGKEAVRFAKECDGILVENLLSKALEGEPVFVEGNSVDPVSMLSLFLKKSLGLLNPICPPERIYALCITVEDLSPKMLQMLEQATAALPFKNTRIYFQSHVESFYHYMLRQDVALWEQPVALFSYGDGEMFMVRMHCSKKTRPALVFLEESKSDFVPYEPIPTTEVLKARRMDMIDQSFLRLAESVLGDERYSSVYLVGPHFDQSWMKASLKFLCKNRRVFQGSNLYSKGACYATLERFAPSEIGQAYLYLGKEKNKVNIGMEVLDAGKATYFPLIDAGINWYEAQAVTELVLEDADSIPITITPLQEAAPKEVRLSLEGIAPGFRRIRLSLYFSSPEVLCIEATDLGFGAVAPLDTDKAPAVWKKQVVSTKGW